MEIIIRPDDVSVAVFAADIFESVLLQGPSVLGLATGSSPVRIYDELISRHRNEGLTFAGSTVFTLDEYVGLSSSHPQSYHHVIRSGFTDHVDLDPARVHGPNGTATDIAGEAARYEEAIRASGGIDLQLVGIGANGHVGFNEPGSSLASLTRIKTLSERTRADNTRFFAPGEQVPTHVVTQGLATIGRARHVVLVATGQAKAGAVAAMAEGPVSAVCPASALQFHPRVTVILDESAAAELRHADYYRFAHRNKPNWQRYPQHRRAATSA